MAVIVVEDIVVRDTLDSVRRTADVHIYCKRVSPAGVWNGDPEHDLMLGNPSSLSEARIDAWSHEYHLRRRPQERATYMFERVEDD